MNKHEFIDRLRAALNGRIPAPQVEDTVNYYQDYINMEMRKGRSEEEVLQSLGDPRLIARTIIQTNGDASGVQAGAYQDSDYRDSYYRDTERQTYGSQGTYDDYGYSRKSFRIPGWLLGLIIALVLFLVISLVFSVLSFLAPVILVLAAVIFMVKLFRDWLN
ncbi:MAG: DUF1700 domain-containing protein [Butyrivibrio sp.]|nr:DUF1700 domain-containing protein [Muribaculum sp.]MCM1552875.1 DUF1700 domain-containing protein [Butyrivibrio sp.]